MGTHGGSMKEIQAVEFFLESNPDADGKVEVGNACFYVSNGVISLRRFSHPPKTYKINKMGYINE